MHDTTSRIDHIFYSLSMNTNELSVLHDSALFDHFPLTFSVKVPSFIRRLSVGDRRVTELVVRFINWIVLTDGNKNYFYSNVLEV